MKSSPKERKKQKLLIFMCWLIYVASYLSRYSYNSNIVAVKDYYNVSNSVTGLVSTFFFFAYGIGQIVNGLLCRKYSKKWFLSLSLIISAGINLYLFTCPPIEVYKYLWLLNGISLSVLWSLLVYTLSENLDYDLLSTATVVMSTPVAFGTVLSYGASSLFNLTGSFKYSYLLGAIAAGSVAVLWFFLCDRLITKKKVIKTEVKNENIKNKKSYTVFLTLVLFGIFMIVNNLVKDGLNTWVPQIIKDTYHFGDSLSIILTLVLPLVGLLGAVFVFSLNRIIKDNVLLNSFLFIMSALCIFGVMKLLKKDNSVPVIVLFGIISLFMHAINNFITSFIPLSLREDFNAGLLAGILNGCGYAGSTISAYCLGLLSDKKGWNSVFVLFLVLCVCVAFLSFVFCVLLKIKKERKKTAA